MRYNPSNESEVRKAKDYLMELIQAKGMFEIKKIPKSRTPTQNKALHLYFTFIADQLNDKNIEYEWKGIKGMQMSCNYNTTIVKEFLWRPIQQQLFNKDSTTTITTQEINEVIDILSKAFAHIGITILFPSYESWATSEILKKYETKN